MKKTIIVFLIAFFAAWLSDILVIDAANINIYGDDTKDAAISFWTSSDIYRNWGASAYSYTSGLGCYQGSGGYYSNTLLWFNITKHIISNETIIDFANISIFHIPPCGGSTGNTKNVDLYALKVGWNEGSGTSESGDFDNVSWSGNDTIGGNWINGFFGPDNYYTEVISQTTMICGSGPGRYTFTFNDWGLNFINGVINGTYENNGFILNLSTTMTGADAYNFIFKENTTYIFIPRMELTYSYTPPRNMSGIRYSSLFCDDENYLYHSVAEINYSGATVFKTYLEYCDYGCSNSTILNLGKPGCKASNLEQLIILIGIVIILIMLFKSVIK